MSQKQATTRAFRPPQENVPPTRKTREDVRTAARVYAAEVKPTVPLSIEEMQRHADALIQRAALSPRYRDFAALLLNNALWQDTVAAIPYHKRLLLLPQCLRDAEQCPARCDDIGLLCEHCGSCVIDQFKSQAETLGYAVLIAEGSPVVMSLIETGRIETVIGVSCLTTLERVYPYMEAGAVPGIAIPLLYDGCKNTAVDVDWVWEAMYETTDEVTHRLDLDHLRQDVDSWFSHASLRAVLGSQRSHTETLALDWLALSGKRWRPFLCAATTRALDPQGVYDGVLQRAAVAVECFHKASLIHDDIEDGDAQRYQRPTLYLEQGTPVALNVGDYLVGEGYRLLAALNLPAHQVRACVHTAAQGHRTLCLGQGEELTWTHQPRILSVDHVLDIFRNKTSPAFNVALHLGAILAHADAATLDVLTQYSQSLGIAYQIRDDLDDLISDQAGRINVLKRPSILLALAHDQGRGEDRGFLTSVWQREIPLEKALDQTLALFTALHVERQAADLLEFHKSRAIGALAALHNAPLKGLLRRVISRIFYDFDIMGCCNDPKK